MDASSALSRVREFVSAFSAVRDVQFSTVPYSLESHKGIAYLLLVASINEGIAAEHVRDLLRALYGELGDDLLTIHKVSRAKYESVLQKFRAPHWWIWGKIPDILSSASKFIEKAEEHGGLVDYGRKQRCVAVAAREIAMQIARMGKGPQGARKKTWMFMRWMVRPEPDIGVWNPPLNPADLCVPLDRNTGKAFNDLAQVAPFKDWMRDKAISLDLEGPGKLKSNARNVRSVTEVARWIFPNDPAQVDYAFFCYGRRFSHGEDRHRCWAIINCDQCSIRELVRCPGKHG